MIDEKCEEFVARHLGAPVNKILGTCNRRISMERWLFLQVEVKVELQRHILI